MPRKKERYENCVYKISFNNHYKVYIGSTSRWPYRKWQHLYGLKNQKHFNQFLQRAVNKYGIESILIEPIEFLEKSDDLTSREQYWINIYDSSNSKMGYNLVKIVTANGTLGYKYTEEQRKRASEACKNRMTRPNERDKISKTVAETISKNPDAYGGKFKAKKHKLLNPSGELIEIENLNKFCRENNLDYKPMIDVAYGKRKEYNGWRHPTREVKTYSFVNPSGEIITTESIRKLCRKENLDVHTMSAIHRDIGISCCGWKKYHPSGIVARHKGKNHLIKNENGDILQVNNLKLFCKENDINYDKLRKGYQPKGFSVVK